MAKGIWRTGTILCTVLAAAFAAPAGAAPPDLPGSRIELRSYTFDPLADGEPSLPAALRARPDSRYALVQLDALPPRELLETVRAAGVAFHDALAGNAWIVRFDAEGAGRIAAKRAEIAALSGVRWVGDLHPAYRIDPALREGRLLVDLFPDADAPAVAAAATDLGAVVVESSENAAVKVLVVEARAEHVAELAAIDGVRWVQALPEYRTVNDQARFVVQTNRRGDLSLYEHGLTGAGQVGGVSDSGLDAFDFDDATGAAVGINANDAGCYFLDDGNDGQGGAQRAPGPGHRKVVAYRVPPGAGGDYTDESGHGTHVVGSVVGDNEPWGEVSPADGQAFDGRIYFQDLNVGGGLTVSPPANYFNLFGPAYDANTNGVYDPAIDPRTHSNSWGGAEPIYDAGTSQADLFMWMHPDFLILYAAGNNGPAPATLGNPATAKNIVTVGATENGQSNPDNMADFSSHGPVPGSGPIEEGSRLKPTVSAPGSGVLSALYKATCGTQELSGTSMATPTTHGVALLMRQYLWDGFHPHGKPTAGYEMQEPPPSAALLKALLINSGRPMPGLFTDNGAGGAWPSNGQGWGSVLADDALYFPGDHRDLWLHDEYDESGGTGFAAAGETRTFTIAVGNGAPFETEPLEITLVWTDYPGSTLDGGRLINNLDLVVTDPLGGTHRGNDPTQNDFLATSDLPTAPDAVNPWEVVYLADPITGVYTVTVQAAALGSLGPDPTRRQGFALVATGDLRSARARAEIEKEAYDPIPTVEARLRVTDLDENADPQAIESVTATVSSTTDAAGIEVTLVETGTGSGTFMGEVTLIVLDQGQSAGPGELAVGLGDEVRLEFDDADDGTGQSAVASDSARVTTASRVLLNPPRLFDPGEVDEDGAYTVSWTAAELSNNNGLTRMLALYLVEKATDYRLELFDDAQAGLAANWTAETATQFSLPWREDVAFNHTPDAPPPGQSFWSQGVEGGADILDIDTRLVLNRDIVIPSSVASARLSFYSRYFNEPDDRGTVEISTDGGASWTALLTLTDAPQAPPPDTRMQQHEIDLTGYRDQAFRIRFRFFSNSNYFFFASAGWWVDDVTIDGATWERIAVVPPDQTELDVLEVDGEHAYRVQAVYIDGTATAFSNVETVVVEGAGGPAGRIPLEAPLLLGKNGDDIVLGWGDSCLESDTDYAVYEGELGTFTSHEPLLCTTGGAVSAGLGPGSGDRYYLVVPRSAVREGSYGLDGAGAERPASEAACLDQAIASCP